MGNYKLQPKDLKEKSIRELSETGPDGETIPIETHTLSDLNLTQIKNYIQHNNETILKTKEFHGGPENHPIWTETFDNLKNVHKDYKITTRINFFKSSNHDNYGIEKQISIQISNPKVKLNNGTTLNNVYFVRVTIDSGTPNEIILIQNNR